MFSWSLTFSTDNIKLGKKIGHGAQAEIFKAKYGRTGLDEVVVKRFLNSRDKSTKQEVAIIQNLTHRHIVQFYHVHHDMIVMEYVEGGNLTDAIVGRAIKSWEIKTQIAKEISLGLAYLHSLGIIHCDIKSPNILLTEHKEVRICDFGLAMRVGESGGGGGTLQWMAPELLQDPPLYSSKSDV
ncbi:p21 protein (Cdc42 Rac)-activated kinase, partial [Mortierella alpina]